MGPKKDIGELFEKKLRKGKKKPSESVFEKINKSLDAERLRKKRILYSWLLGTGLISVFLLFIVFNNQDFFQNNWPKQKNEIPETNNATISTESSTESTGEKHNIKELFKTSQEDTSNYTNEIVEKSSHLVIKNQDLELDEKEKSSNLKSKNNKGTRDTFDENATVTKNYHYYDSRNKQSIVTQNKNEIDSLVFGPSKSLDSVTTTKTDSIKQ